jgi:hypothetical protein
LCGGVFVGGVKRVFAVYACGVYAGVVEYNAYRRVAVFNAHWRIGYGPVYNGGDGRFVRNNSMFGTAVANTQKTFRFAPCGAAMDAGDKDDVQTFRRKFDWQRFLSNHNNSWDIGGKF